MFDCKQFVLIHLALQVLANIPGHDKTHGANVTVLSLFVCVTVHVCVCVFVCFSACLPMWWLIYENDMYKMYNKILLFYIPLSSSHSNIKKRNK